MNEQPKILQILKRSVLVQFDLNESTMLIGRFVCLAGGIIIKCCRPFLIINQSNVPFAYHTFSSDLMIDLM